MKAQNSRSRVAPGSGGFTRFPQARTTVTLQLDCATTCELTLPR